jgi:hypothetical protein
MGDATQEEFPEVGNEVAEEAEEYPVADDEDLAGFGGEHEGSDLILGMMPLPLKVPRETPLLTMSLSDASRALTLSFRALFSMSAASRAVSRAETPSSPPTKSELALILLSS